MSQWGDAEEFIIILLFSSGSAFKSLPDASSTSRCFLSLLVVESLAWRMWRMCHFNKHMTRMRPIYCEMLFDPQKFSTPTILIFIWAMPSNQPAIETGCTGYAEVQEEEEERPHLRIIIIIDSGSDNANIMWLQYCQSKWILAAVKGPSSQPVNIVTPSTWRGPLSCSLAAAAAPPICGWLRIWMSEWMWGTREGLVRGGLLSAESSVGWMYLEWHQRGYLIWTQDTSYEEKDNGMDSILCALWWGFLLFCYYERTMNNIDIGSDQGV